MARVLLIDDDEFSLALGRNILEEEGYEVHSTADGPQAIDLYQRTRPDVVLLDVGLPSMSGLGVLKAIRHIDKEAKVIVVTGYDSGKNVEIAYESGASGFVRKPADFHKILAMIEELIRPG
jgi:two-component system chemotaxis response regulator CheY